MESTNPDGLSQRAGTIADLREHNLSQVLRALALDGPLSRAEIADACRLGVSALTALVSELESRDLVTELPDPLPSTRGRPRYPLTMESSSLCFLALDCSRTYVDAAIGRVGGSIVHRRRTAIDGPAGWAHYREQLEAAVHTLVREAAQRGLRPVVAEISVPGAVDRASGRVVRSVLNGWQEVALRNDVHAFLSEAGESACAVGVDRETNYAVRAHLALGRGLEGRSPVVYIGGTQAVGGAIATEGGVDHGATGLAGEIGHMVVDPRGSRCWCGRRGCVETKLGLRAIYAATTGRPEPAFDALVTDAEAMRAEIRARVNAGDGRAVAALTEAGRWLGITIDAVAAVVNPGNVIVDGHLGDLTRCLEPSTTEYLAAHRDLPALSELSVEFVAPAADTVVHGMLTAARGAVVASPALALPTREGS